MPRTILIGCLAWLMCGCSRSTPSWDASLPKTLRVSSSAFEDGQPIPSKYTEDGENVSPPIAWDNLPSDAKILVLICDDPDAPGREPWVHWILYNISAKHTELPAGLKDAATDDAPFGEEGLNSWTTGVTSGYRGPAPTQGALHHYRFRLYALHGLVNLRSANRQSLFYAMPKSGVIAWGELIGTYQR